MKKEVIILLLLTMLTAGHLFAAEKGQIELRSVAEVEETVSNEKGEKEIKRVAAKDATVIPGGIVIFTTTYKNIGDKDADDVVIDNPVPQHMTYVDFSAEGKGASITFSIDDGKSYDFVGNLKVKNADGTERKAVAKDYTHIRWTLEKSINPGGKGSVVFRAKLN